MENQREDLPRISVDSMQDWQRVKESYSSVALSILEEELSSVKSPSEAAALRTHVQQVKFLVFVGVLLLLTAFKVRR